MTTTPNEQYKSAFDTIVARMLARINDRIGSKDVLVAALRPLWTGGILSETMIRTLFLIPVNDRIRTALAEAKAADGGDNHQDLGDKVVTLFMMLCEESFRSTQNNGICRDGHPHPCVAVVATLLQNDTPNKATQLENKVDDLLISWGVMLSNALNAISNARRGNYVSETLIRLFRLMSALQDYAKDPKRFARMRLTTGEVSAQANTTTNRREDMRASFEVDITTRGAVEYASRRYPRNFYGDITMDQDSTRAYLRRLARLEWLEHRADEGYDEDVEGNNIDDAIDEATQECNDFLRNYERDHYYEAEDSDDCESDDDWDNYDSNTDDEEFASSETDYDIARERILREFRPEINALVTEMEEATR